VDRIGTGCEGSLDHSQAIEQVDGLPSILPRDDHPDAEAIRRPPDPGGDLAPVRNEQGPNRLDRECGRGCSPGSRRGGRLVALRGRILSWTCKRVNSVKCDTPATTDPPCREAAESNPTLYRSGCGSNSLGGLSRRQFIGHGDAIVALE
jgi:hypothetical protein